MKNIREILNGISEEFRDSHFNTERIREIEEMVSNTQTLKTLEDLSSKIKDLEDDSKSIRQSLDLKY